MTESLNYINDLPSDIVIMCGDNQQIPSNKFLLSVFSPTLRLIFSDPKLSSKTLCFPDFTSSSVKQFLNIISMGFATSRKASYRDIAEVIEIARMLQVEILNLEEDMNDVLEVEEDIVSIPTKDEPNKPRNVLSIFIEDEEPEIDNLKDICATKLKPDLGNDKFEEMSKEHLQSDGEIVKNIYLNEENVSNEKNNRKRTISQVFDVKVEDQTDEGRLEKRKLHQREQKRRRAQSMTPAQKQTKYAASRENAYLLFLEYCFSRSDVHFDKQKPRNTWETAFFEKYEDVEIYSFFHDFFRSLKVNRKTGDGSLVANAKPKSSTTEVKRSHIKNTLLQKHEINLADPVKFPNYRSDWKKVLDIIHNLPDDEFKFLPNLACHQCEYVAKESRLLKTHIQSVHEKLRFPCNICGFKAYKNYLLKKHLESECQNNGRKY